jgi:hypothetical protein
MASKTPQEAARSLGNTISSERLIEPADAGYAPHSFIDGRGPWFKITELREWFDHNTVQARGGLPMPTRLSLIVAAESRPASDAPESISRLIGLRHIDPAHLLCPGVYFLCLGDEVVYVGQSVNVPDRVISAAGWSTRGISPTGITAPGRYLITWRRGRTRCGPRGSRRVTSRCR